MPSTRTLCGFVLLVAGLLASGQAIAQKVGIIQSLAPGAIVERDGGLGRLVERAAILNGDVIRTDETGTVQMIFQDRTRVVVGPNSRFVVEDVALGRGDRARNFVVSALSGTFRFLSGNSPKESYEIRTPTATLGVRGTIFDLSVDGRGKTSLVTLEGTVRMCGRGRRCADVVGGCAMAQTQSFGRVSAPKDRKARDTALTRLFPFILSQSRLQRGYWARTESCGDIETTTLNLPPRVAPPVPITGAQNQSQTASGGANSAGGNNSSGNTGGGSSTSGGTNSAGGSGSGGNQAVKDAVPSGGS